MENWRALPVEGLGDENDAMARIVAPLGLSAPDPRREPLVDFAHLTAEANGRLTTARSVPCRTIRKAGARKAFLGWITTILSSWRPSACARAFGLSAATGTDPRYRFYNRVKGEVEEAIRSVGIPSLAIVRPALIGGDREEFRPAEFMAMRPLQLAEPLLPRRYQVVPHERTARALLEAGG